MIESFTQRGDTELDPFAGSGSTLAAAAQLGRRWVGIELDATNQALAIAVGGDLAYDLHRAGSDCARYDLG